MENLTEIGVFDDLLPGDKIQLVINPRPWLGEIIGAYITAAKISAAQDNPKFKVLNWSYNSAGGVTLHIEIVKPAMEYQTAGISPWMIALAIIGVSIAFVSVTTYKVVDVISDPDNPNAQKIASGIQWFSAAALMFVGYIWLKRK